MNRESESTPVQGSSSTVLNQSEPYTSQSEPHNQSVHRGRIATRLKEISLSLSAAEKIKIQFDNIGILSAQTKADIGVFSTSLHATSLAF